MKRLALAFVLLLILSIPVMGQDVESTVEANPVSIVTAEAPVNTTVEDGGVVINVEAPDAPVETPAPPVDNTPWGIILSILLVGVGVMVTLSFGLQALGNRARAVGNDPSAVSLLERGYDTIIPDAVKAAVGPVKESLERSDQALQDMIALVRKITDGVPEASKVTPPPASSVSSTPYASASTLSADPSARMPDNG